MLQPHWIYNIHIYSLHVSNPASIHHYNSPDTMYNDKWMWIPRPYSCRAQIVSAGVLTTYITILTTTKPINHGCLDAAAGLLPLGPGALYLRTHNFGRHNYRITTIPRCSTMVILYPSCMNLYDVWLSIYTVYKYGYISKLLYLQYWFQIRNVTTIEDHKANDVYLHLNHRLFATSGARSSLPLEWPELQEGCGVPTSAVSCCFIMALKPFWGM